MSIYHPEDMTLYGDTAVWGKVPDADRCLCSHMSMDGVCANPATHHIVWDFDRASPMCTEHMEFVKDGGDFLDIHEHDPAVCPLDDAEFDGDHNRCVLKRTS